MLEVVKTAVIVRKLGLISFYSLLSHFFYAKEQRLKYKIADPHAIC